MILYLAIDENGRRTLAGNQADAKKINKDFQQIDVPVDKTGLMEFFQQVLDEAAEQVKQASSSSGSSQATPVVGSQEERDSPFDQDDEPEPVEDTEDHGEAQRAGLALEGSSPSPPQPVTSGSTCPKCSFDPARTARNIETQIKSLTSDQVINRIMGLSGWELGAAAGAVASRYTELASELAG